MSELTAKGDETPPDPDHERAKAVQAMFGSIAQRYDFLNHLLSLNIDRHWRRVCLREVKRCAVGRKPAVLDLGCGTADLALEFSTLGSVVACDFSQPMLALGSRKIAAADLQNPISLLAGDALRLPFPDALFDVVVSAFVLRNLANIHRGLEEMRRVLRPGGTVGILDFGVPRVPLLGWLYMIYFSRILPRLGKVVSGVEGPYRYLPDSVRSFPPAEELCALMIDKGFTDVRHLRMTGGVAVLFLARA